MNDTRSSHLARLDTTEIGNTHPWFLHYHSYHRDLFAAFKTYATGKLLDIGCGNKPYQGLLSQSVVQYIGCDIIQSSDERVDVICPANQVPLQNESFDTVISTQTIEHVEDHFGLITEAFRLLKPDGYFILSGPMYCSTDNSQLVIDATGNIIGCST